MGFFIFLFVLLALLNIFFPRIGWYMRYGWMVKGDVEPSEAYLLLYFFLSGLVSDLS